MNWLDLSGQVAVVTGAGAGIGRGIALALAEAGAAVAILDRDESGRGAAADINASGGSALFVACDVTDDASVTQAQRQIKEWQGPPSILVNNAGTMRNGALETMAMADWDAVLALNLTGYFRCARIFGAPMLARGQGSIVHIASISATAPQSFSGAYSIAKAGVAMLSRQLAVEWGPRGVRSNVVSPGMIETAMTEGIYAMPGVRETRERLVPSRRIGQPRDVANAVVFLASARADYINGEEVIVDGGFTRTIMSQIPRPGFEASDTVRNQ